MIVQAVIIGNRAVAALYSRVNCQVSKYFVSNNKMVKKYEVDGYDAFCEFMKKFESKGKHIHILFSGSKLPTGESWCDDCIRAAPVIEKALEKADPESHFIYVTVGDRATWKDMNCAFRKDKKTNLMVIPTLVRWGQPQKLEGEQCEKSELVEMLFTDE